MLTITKVNTFSPVFKYIICKIEKGEERDEGGERREEREKKRK
jgi:hypothetical protein